MFITLVHSNVSHYPMSQRLFLMSMNQPYYRVVPSQCNVRVMINISSRALTQSRAEALRMTPTDVEAVIDAVPPEQFKTALQDNPVNVDEVPVMESSDQVQTAVTVGRRTLDCKWRKHY